MLGLIRAVLDRPLYNQILQAHVHEGSCMSNPFKRNRFNRKLGIESLESRQLFAVLSGSDDLTMAT